MRGVPRIDLADLGHADAAVRVATAATLRDGLVEFGFVRVAGHGVEAAQIDRVHDGFARFFALPESDKRALAGIAGGQRGFTPFGIEHAKDQPVPDLKEFFHIGQEDPGPGASAELYPANVWPAEPRSLRHDALALYRALEAAAARLLEAIARSFDLPADAFAGMIAHGNSILRALHYPPIADGTDPRAARSAPHEDINLITLLCQATDSGLEILTRDGAWLPVDANADEIIADAGDMLERITNDVVPATTHRVVASSATASRHRYALPFFAHPRPDCELRVLPAFLSGGEAPRHSPTTAQAFLEERLREIGLLDRDGSPPAGGFVPGEATDGDTLRADDARRCR